MDVSIIIPVYNCEKYLNQCLNSVLNQKTNCSYEIICINDGSTDRSIEILNKYQGKIKIIDIENSGPGKARNIGISESSGEFLMFVDSDDYVSDNFVEKMYQTIIENNADVCISDFYRVYDHRLEHIYKGNKEIYYKGNFDKPLLMEYHSANKIIRKSIFVSYPEDMFFEDVVAISLSLLNAKKIVKIDDALYYYRCVKESTTNTLSNKIYDINKALNTIENTFIKNGYLDVIEYLYVNNILVDLCIKIIKSKRIDAKKQVFKYLNIINNKYPNWSKNKYLQDERFMKRLYLFFLKHHFYAIIYSVYGMR